MSIRIECGVGETISVSLALVCRFILRQHSTMLARSSSDPRNHCAPHIPFHTMYGCVHTRAYCLSIFVPLILLICSGCLDVYYSVISTGCAACSGSSGISATSYSLQVITTAVRYPHPPSTTRFHGNPSKFPKRPNRGRRRTRARRARTGSTRTSTCDVTISGDVTSFSKNPSK